MIQETRDLILVKEILSEQYGELIDDGSPDINDFYPPEEAIYLLSLSSKLDGVVVFYPHNAATLEGHICMREHCRGKDAIEHGKAAIQWVFDNTPFHKIIINVPEFKKNVRRYSFSVGFKDEGINRLSFLKDGKLYDQHLMGITRLETCQ